MTRLLLVAALAAILFPLAPTLAFAGVGFPFMSAPDPQGLAVIASAMLGLAPASSPVFTAPPKRYDRKDASAENTPGGNGEVQEAIAAVKTSMHAQQRQIEAFAEDVKKQLEKSGDLSPEMKNRIDQALTKGTENDARLNELEQKLARNRSNDNAPQAKSWGQSASEAAEFGKLANSRGRASVTVERSAPRFDAKAVTSLTAASGGTLVVPDRQPNILPLLLRRRTIRDLLIPGETSSNAITYVRETGFTNAANAVAESALKPESNLTFDTVTTAVATVAHWLLASRQILEDVPQLRSFIDGRLRVGLEFADEAQLLRGNGVAPNILGIVPQAAAFADQGITVPSANRIDVLRVALLQVRLQEMEANGFVMNPSAWAGIELAKDSTGAYIWANPAQQLGATLWGKPVVETTAMAAEEFLAGAFNQGAQIFDRSDAEVLASTEDGDNFRRNMVTILAEQREALAVYRPAAFVTGTFTAALNTAPAAGAAGGTIAA